MNLYYEQLKGLGPFTLPQKKGWLLCGAGPSFDLAKSFISENPDFGVFAVNGSITGLDRVDVWLFAHYEIYVRYFWMLNKSDLVYISDPCHVGESGVEVSTANLFNFHYFIDQHPWRIRFYEKDGNLERSIKRPYTLYHGCTAASAAIHLLARNNVKELAICGIDGGKGHAKSLEECYKVYDSVDFNPFLDNARIEVFDLAKKLGVKLFDLKENQKVPA